MLTLTTRSDERLARSVAHGDDDAFALLYKRYEPTLFGYCRSITRNYDDACDALQNVSMKALVALRGAERTAPVRPWLFRIAHNESINVLRRRPAVAPESSVVDTAPSVDEQYAEREKIDEIVRDLRELPTGQRAAIVLRELAELDYNEIAVALDINENNARQLVFAARASLKDSRSGRGLPCESVREHITSTEGRRLRRRILKAHLQTCEPCRVFAQGRRRARPRRGGVLGLFSPAPLFAALSDGFSSVFGSVALKGAAALAVATAGLGAAGVAPEVARSPQAEASPKTESEPRVATPKKDAVERVATSAVAASPAPAAPVVAPAASAASRAPKKTAASSSSESDEAATVDETAADEEEADEDVPVAHEPRGDRERRPQGGYSEGERGAESQQRPPQQHRSREPGLAHQQQPPNLPNYSGDSAVVADAPARRGR